MKEYIYFVSYAHGKDSYFGFGSAEVPMYKRLNSRQDILAISEVLCSKDKTLFNTVILFFKLLRIVEVHKNEYPGGVSPRNAPPDVKLIRENSE